MKEAFLFIILTFLIIACQSRPSPWNGPVLTNPRDHLTVDELLVGKSQPFIDMSYFAKPNWAKDAKHAFSGTITIEETELNYLKEKEHYPGENFLPKLQLDLLSHDGVLIPLVKEKLSTKDLKNGFWDIMLGAGEVWYEEEDGDWNRASFPINLNDRWIGTVRNCVATFVYKPDSISNLCLQCSQETADIEDKGIADINGTIPAKYEVKQFANSIEVIERHKLSESNRLPIRPLSEIDTKNEIADYFDRPKATSAPTSLGAIFLDDTLYVHPPKTRHGLYPYPNEMRHGLYSVTKSMAGALALMFFEERYNGDVFKAQITDYVPALANHAGWEGVTFSHALNMVTGIDGGEDASRLLDILIAAETAEQAINNIATLKNLPESPGQKFNYATTNLFVLSYALQQFVEEKEGAGVKYWDLVQEHVLAPIGAAYFTVLHTIEKKKSDAIPILGYGALPTIDEAAKISLLFANEGRYKGAQLLNKQRTKEVFGLSIWKGHSTNNDFRGSNYQHAFWSKEIKAEGCAVRATFMLGFGEHYVVYLPSGAILFRFLDERDLNIDKLIRAVEEIKSSCQ